MLLFLERYESVKAHKFSLFLNIVLYLARIQKIVLLARTRLTYNCAHLRSTKEKKEENIWRRKIFFAEGTINGGGKGK